VLHSDDHISLLVSCFDIPVSLNHLFQRITSIYDRPLLPRLDQLFEEDQIITSRSTADKDLPALNMAFISEQRRRG
jgi:hypothetical protein